MMRSVVRGTWRDVDVALWPFGVGAARVDRVGPGRGRAGAPARGRAVADAAWLATAACGIGYAVWSAIDSIRYGRVGVDLIALLALTGAVATRELLAAAVVSVMLASGRALEAWADSVRGMT